MNLLIIDACSILNLSNDQIKSSQINMKSLIAKLEKVPEKTKVRMAMRNISSKTLPSISNSNTI